MTNERLKEFTRNLTITGAGADINVTARDCDAPGTCGELFISFTVLTDDEPKRAAARYKVSTSCHEDDLAQLVQDGVKSSIRSLATRGIMFDQSEIDWAAAV